MSTTTVIHPKGGSHQAEPPFVSRTKTPEPFTLVLFGATGDLAGRKLLPALAGLLQNEYLPTAFAILAVGRRDKNDQAFRDDAQKSLAEFRGNESADNTADFVTHVF